MKTKQFLFLVLGSARVCCAHKETVTCQKVATSE